MIISNLSSDVCSSDLKNRISVEQSGVKHNSSTIVLQSYFRTYAIASVLLCTGLCRGGGIRLGQGGKSEIAHRGAERQHESLTLYLLQGAKACPGQKGGPSKIGRAHVELQSLMRISYA